MPTADELFDRHSVENLAAALRSAEPALDMGHLQHASTGLHGRSLRERSDDVRDALLADIPGGYWRLAEVVRHTAGACEEFTGWMIWPVTSAVAVRAVQEGTVAAFEDGLNVLAELTHRLTSEFAIRILLRHDADRALGLIHEWTRSPDEHVRRLASEGTRPYLPWAVRVPQLRSSPGVTLPIVDALYQDESEYVRRSVANHLNDLSRDQPELAIAAARQWLASPAPTTAWVVRHGLRTSIKRGHADALQLLGFGPASIQVPDLRVEQAEVPWSGTVRFLATLRNTGSEDARLMIDYVLAFRRANGSLSEKTFKLTTAMLPAGGSLTIEREHSFRPITTRRYYPGVQTVSLQVNGMTTDAVQFELLPPHPLRT